MRIGNIVRLSACAVTAVWCFLYARGRPEKPAARASDAIAPGAGPVATPLARTTEKSEDGEQRRGSEIASGDIGNQVRSTAPELADISAEWLGKKLEGSIKGFELDSSLRKLFGVSNEDWEEFEAAYAGVLARVKEFESANLEVVEGEDGVSRYELAPMAGELESLFDDFESEARSLLGESFAHNAMPELLDRFFYLRSTEPFRMHVEIQDDGDIALVRKWVSGDSERKSQEFLDGKGDSKLSPVVERFGHIFGVSSADELRQLIEPE